MIVIFFTSKRRAELDLLIPLSYMFFLAPCFVYLVGFILIPGERLKKADLKLVATTSELDRAFMNVSCRNSVINFED